MILRRLRALLNGVAPVLSIDLDLHMQEVVRGTSTAFVMKVVGAGLSFVLNVVVARVLGARGTGAYYLALTVVSIAAVVGRLGLDSALLRYTAAYSTSGDIARVRGTYRGGMLVAVSAGLAVTGLVELAAGVLARDLFSAPELVVPLRLMALAILPISLISLHTELLKGLRRIGRAMLLRGFGVPLLAIPAVFFLGTRMGVRGVVLGYTAAAVVVCSVGIGLWRVSAPAGRGEPARMELRRLMSTSYPLLWATVLQLVMTWTDTLALGVWRDNRTVGIYGAAMRVATLISFVLLAGNAILAPKFASLYEQRDLDRLGRLARDAAKLLFLLTLPIVGIIVLAPSLVLGIFGAEFRAGAVALIILAAGQAINVFTGSVGNLLVMSGHERTMRNVYVVAAAASVILNVVLVPPFGMVGAAIASACSLAALNLLAALLVYRKLSIVTLPIPSLLLGRAHS